MIFKEVMREYDRLQNKSRRVLEERRHEVYTKIPRIKDIDTELSLAGVRIARLVIGRGVDESQQLAEELKNTSMALVREKNSLLTKYGYSVDYFLDIYDCAKCKDTGFIGTEQCACLKQRFIKRYYMLSNLSDVLEYENFETFDFRFYSTEKKEGQEKSPYERIMTIHQACFRFVEKFDLDEEYSNLLFYGTPGLGKTFMCNCIAKDLLHRNKTVLYTTAPKIFEVVSDLHFNKDEKSAHNKDLVDFIYTTDLLIIDDLGTELPTVFTSSELFNFINTRILQRRRTIISTNLSLKELRDMYSERISSRILGNYMSLHFLGSDIRQQKKYRR